MTNIYGKYNNLFQDKIDSLLIKSKKKIQSLKPALSEDYYEIIDNYINNMVYKYFECVNGYIGFDAYVSYYNAYHLLFWYYVLIDKRSTEDEKNTATLEIEIWFYQWISTMYNIENKIYKILSCKRKGKHIETDNSCITDKGKSNINIIIRKYTDLINYLDARCHIIHEKYDIDLSKEEEKIFLHSFNFDFSNKPIEKKNRNFSFDINDTEIPKINTAIVHLIDDIKEFILKKENFDYDMLIEKFKNEKGHHVFNILGE